MATDPLPLCLERKQWMASYKNRVRFIKIRLGESFLREINSHQKRKKEEAYYPRFLGVHHSDRPIESSRRTFHYSFDTTFHLEDQNIMCMIRNQSMDHKIFFFEKKARNWEDMGFFAYF
jgi:hypothetical protein